MIVHSDFSRKLIVCDMLKTNINSVASFVPFDFGIA